MFWEEEVSRTGDRTPFLSVVISTGFLAGYFCSRGEPVCFSTGSIVYLGSGVCVCAGMAVCVGVTSYARPQPSTRIKSQKTGNAQDNGEERTQDVLRGKPKCGKNHDSPQTVNYHYRINIQ